MLSHVCARVAGVHGFGRRGAGRTVASCGGRDGRAGRSPPRVPPRARRAGGQRRLPRGRRQGVPREAGPEGGALSGREALRREGAQIPAGAREGPGQARSRGSRALGYGPDARLRRRQRLNKSCSRAVLW
eukprot:3074077-Prymnesium_polylepis.1